MSESLIPSTGEYADIALGPDGVPCICAETADRSAVNLYRGASAQQLIAFCVGALIEEPENGGWRIRAYYPRLAINPNADKAVAYQKGPRICLDLIGVRVITRPDQEIPIGTEMVCVGWVPSASFWRLAYVAEIFGARKLVTRDYDRDGRELDFKLVPTDTSQGISRIELDGSVVLFDNDDWARPINLSRPFRAGGLTVGQGNDAPARCLGYLNGDASTAYRIFDGLAYRSRAVEVTPGRWIVIATGVQGVRVVEVPPFVLDIAVEPPPPPPPPPPVAPRVTIADYQPREGTAPLTIQVAAIVSGGPATMLVVSAKRDPDSINSEDDNPQQTTTHELRLPWPGRYELSAQVTGPGGEGRTESTRIVTVNEKQEEQQTMYRVPRDIIAAGRAELRRLYKTHLLRDDVDEDGWIAWFFDHWIFAVFQGPNPGGNAAWQSRLSAANTAMRKALQAQVPNPPGEGWPQDPR